MLGIRTARPQAGRSGPSHQSTGHPPGDCPGPSHARTRWKALDPHPKAAHRETKEPKDPRPIGCTTHSTQGHRATPARDLARPPARAPPHTTCPTPRPGEQQTTAPGQGCLPTPLTQPKSSTVPSPTGCHHTRGGNRRRQQRRACQPSKPLDIQAEIQLCKACSEACEEMDHRGNAGVTGLL
ncbi:zinc finger protein 318-like [Echeneis naucrates]|uniref:zinc finger protein 318-like n=1 Tax=Echeneis naucrates TaxID=173247 RepID=UPI00111384E4|nr:zinc finger protein 318-like [Echeneis naucrates]